MSVVSQGDGGQSSVSRGIAGTEGAQGPQGTPGVDAIPKTLSTDAVKSRAVEPDPANPGKVRAIVSRLYKRIAGVFTATSNSGTTQPIQHAGPIDPADKTLGAGIACAVGYDASGNLVRITDVACVSELSLAGWCDEAGVITVAPVRPDRINVLEWGFDATGRTANDAQLATLFARIDTSMWKQQVIYFPAGTYRFDAPWPAIPPGCWIVGAGKGSSFAPRYYTGAGTTLAFFGNGSGVLFQTGGFATNASHKGGLRDLTIVSGNSNGASSYPSIAECGIEIIGDVAVTIHNVRVGGWKYPVSVDGGEGIWISEVNFDANQFTVVEENGSWSTYTGYADINTDRDYISFTSSAPTVTFAATARTITRASGSFLADGFKPGDKVVITGTASNNGTWYPHNVTALTMTLVDTGLNPVTDEASVAAVLTVTDQFDSGCCIRIGEWKFQVGGSANGVFIDRAHYNTGRFGTWHKGGVGHYVYSGVYELGGGYAVVDGANQLVFSQLSGEGYDVGPGTFAGGQVTYNAAARTLTRISGSWITDGFHDDNTIRSSATSANNQGMLRVQSVTALVLTLVPGSVIVDEVAASPTIRSTGQAGIWIRAGGGPVGMAVDRCQFGRLNPAVKNDGTLYGLAFDKNECSATYPSATSGGTYPLDGPGLYYDLDGGSNILPPERAILARNYSAASAFGTKGTPINHRTLVRAALDTVLYDYALPYLLLRAQDHDHFEAWGTAYNGGTNQWHRRVYSPNTATPGGLLGDVLETHRSAALEGAFTMSVVPITNYLGGWIDVTVTAANNLNNGELAWFKLRRRFHREDGGSTSMLLDGSTTVVESDDQIGSCPVPTIVAVGTGQALPYSGLVGVGASVTGHATKTLEWTVRSVVLAAGR